MQAHVVGQVDVDRTEHRLALARRQQQVVRREVEAVGPGEVVVRAGRGIGRVPDRRGGAVVQGQVVEEFFAGRARSIAAHRPRRIAEREAALRDRRAAGGQTRAGFRPRGLLPIRCADALLLVVAGREHTIEALAATAQRQRGLGGLAAAAVFAVVGVDLDAFELLAGDDVHHAGDGVGAVDGRCAVLQHFDAIDDGQRDGVEVGAATDARRGRLIHPADAVHQHQHALRAQMAQVDLRGAGADAAAVGGIAEVARGIELRVQRLAAGGELLEDFANALHARLGDLLAVQHEHRLRGHRIGLLDAAAGHGDRIEGGGFLRHGHGGNGEEYGNLDGRSQFFAACFHGCSLRRDGPPGRCRASCAFVVKNP